jgi:hypothetical protein
MNSNSNSIKLENGILLINFDEEEKFFSLDDPIITGCINTIQSYEVEPFLIVVCTQNSRYNYNFFSRKNNFQKQFGIKLMKVNDQNNGNIYSLFHKIDSSIRRENRKYGVKLNNTNLKTRIYYNKNKIISYLKEDINNFKNKTKFEVKFNNSNSSLLNQQNLSINNYNNLPEIVNNPNLKQKNEGLQIINYVSKDFDKKLFIINYGFLRKTYLKNNNINKGYISCYFSFYYKNNDNGYSCRNISITNRFNEEPTLSISPRDNNILNITNNILDFIPRNPNNKTKLSLEVSRFNLNELINISAKLKESINII